jgi:hypothetical protein
VRHAGALLEHLARESRIRPAQERYASIKSVLTKVPVKYGWELPSAIAKVSYLQNVT